MGDKAYLNDLVIKEAGVRHGPILHQSEGVYTLSPFVSPVYIAHEDRTYCLSAEFRVPPDTDIVASVDMNKREIAFSFELNGRNVTLLQQFRKPFTPWERFVRWVRRAWGKLVHA